MEALKILVFTLGIVLLSLADWVYETRGSRLRVKSRLKTFAITALLVVGGVALMAVAIVPAVTS